MFVFTKGITMEGIWIAIITSIIAPAVLFVLQLFKSRKDDSVKKLDDKLIDIQRDLLRLQILNLVQHDPKNKSAILELYDVYKSEPYNGNSYIKEIIKQWRKNDQD